VRGGRGIGGDVHLDPALLGIDPRLRRSATAVVTRCVCMRSGYYRIGSCPCPIPFPAGFSPAEEAAWYGPAAHHVSAPRARAVSPGRTAGLLLVKPKLPGSLVAAGRDPRARRAARTRAARRGGQGGTRPRPSRPGRLLVVGLGRPARGAAQAGSCTLSSTAGRLAEDVPIQLAGGRARRVSGSSSPAAPGRTTCRRFISTRVAAGLRARDDGTTAYLPWTEP